MIVRQFVADDGFELSDLAGAMGRKNHVALAGMTKGGGICPRAVLAPDTKS